MVVVLILGLLAAIGIPTYRAAKIEAERKIVETNLRTIDAAIQLYIESGNWGIAADAAFNTEDSELIPDYLPSPITGPGDTVYHIAGGDTTDRSEIPHAFVYSSSGVGGHVFRPFDEHPLATVENLPWNN